MYKLYDWLADKLAIHCKEGKNFIDVGVYHGDFTQQMMALDIFSKAILFEPNNNHYTFLKDKFKDDEKIYLYPQALGSKQQSQEFYCSQDDATGSLLHYHDKYHHESSGKVVETSIVNVVDLDTFYADHFKNESIGLIKIDTQGFDLEVLKGAEKLIREHQPWLVVELNFLPFYHSQASISSVFSWLTNAGYSLGGFFNDHYSGDQWLAFADGVFVPEGVIHKALEPFIPRLFSQELIEKNAYLQTVCDERLALINQLSEAAESRLNMINKLTEKSMKKKDKKFFFF